ncbi:MAG: helicase-related protein, partial [Planctomycetaceae bacterium]
VGDGERGRPDDGEMGRWGDGEPEERETWRQADKEQIQAAAPLLTATAAEQVYSQLKAGELKNFRVGLVHGQLKREETDRVMQEFREGEIQVLVSTTVIEVGVDVPNATLMVILDAERFGLSQLHQLRGRVARGKFHGYCFLFSDSHDEDAVKRLSALEATTNGFQIAETDFQLRGPGDVLGTRQHGQLPFRIASLVENQTELNLAKDQAVKILESGQWDQPEFAALKKIVTERFGALMNVAQTG